MSVQDEVREVVRREGVIARKQHPELAGALSWLVRRGELFAVLPGVYAGAPDLPVAGRVAALFRWDPNAVLVGRTAAQLTFWPGLPGPVVECALRWDRAPQRGYCFTRRVVPPELVTSGRGLRATVPALTALDLCDQVGGDGIDHALRTRAATLPGLRRALELTGGRRGNRDRRWLVLDSRAEPWSAAERLCHRLLREARIDGWKANWPLRIEGRQYYLDVAFPDLRLVLEIDGRLHEDDEDVFESDRWRQNALVLHGWTVLRFTWRMLTQHSEEVVAAVPAALPSIRSAR